MNVRVFSLIGVVLIIAALYVGYKYGSSIPGLNAL
jgi:hypothetical protein